MHLYSSISTIVVVELEVSMFLFQMIVTQYISFHHYLDGNDVLKCILSNVNDD